MLNPKEEMVVYRYAYWDEAGQTHKESKLYATIEVIKSLGRPIYDASKRVSASELIDGFYVPESVKPRLEE